MGYGGEFSRGLNIPLAALKMAIKLNLLSTHIHPPPPQQPSHIYKDSDSKSLKFI